MQEFTVSKGNLIFYVFEIKQKQLEITSLVLELGNGISYFQVYTLMFSCS